MRFLISFVVMLANDLLLRAARGESIERYPVWLMRQAGRILPQYRKVRTSVSGFKELVQTPHLAAEVTLQPVDHLGVDAAILFSDILVVPQAMGCDYELIESLGPHLPHTIREQADLARLAQVDFDLDDRLAYVFEAIRFSRENLADRVPLIGFAGAPWTIFCYMVEGQGSKTFSKARQMLYKQPSLARNLLERITRVTINYLKAQIRAGVHIVQVFDSWAGILTYQHYLDFIVPCLQQIATEITEVPTILFPKGLNVQAMERVAQLKYDVIGLDWNTDAGWMRSIVKETKTIQGNLDPCALYASHKDVEQITKKMLENFVSSRHIVNLGHGLYPDTDPQKVKIFIETVKDFQLK